MKTQLQGRNIMNIADEIKKLHELQEAGVLSKEEYESAKKSLLKSTQGKQAEFNLNIFFEQNYNSIVGVLTVVILLLVLGFLNPTKEDFKEYLTLQASKLIESKIDKKDSSSVAMGGFAKMIANIYIENQITRNSFGIFSIHNLDTSAIRRFNSDIQDIQFIGIASFFIPLDPSRLNNIVKGYEEKITDSESATERAVQAKVDELEAEAEKNAQGVVKKNKDREGTRFENSYMQLDKEFMTQVSDSNKVMTVQIALMTHYDQRVFDNVKKNEFAIRSAVLNVMRQVTESDLKNQEFRTDLAAKIKVVMNDVLMKKESFAGIEDVFFTSFVVQ